MIFVSILGEISPFRTILLSLKNFYEAYWNKVHFYRRIFRVTNDGWVHRCTPCPGMNQDINLGKGWYKIKVQWEGIKLSWEKLYRERNSNSNWERILAGEKFLEIAYFLVFAFVGSIALYITKELLYHQRTFMSPINFYITNQIFINLFANITTTIKYFSKFLKKFT